MINYLVILTGLHLAPPGSRYCDNGLSVSKQECENAAKNFFPTPSRNLQLGSGCTDGWENVPLGCSVQSVGDGTAHYKVSEDANCPSSHANYQVVCQNDGKLQCI